MKRLLGLLLCALLVFAAAEIANAVSYSAKSWIYSSGQAFSFDVSSAELSYGPGTFLIEAKGDYSEGDSSWEYLDWNIDGLISGSKEAPDNADWYIEHGSNDVEWGKTITIDATTLANITSDSQLNVVLDNSSHVTFYYAMSDYVKWTLTYSKIAPAPEPSTWILFLFGLVGMVGVKKKRKHI